MSGPFDRDTIIDLFDALSRELARRGSRADLFLVGGAAIAVAYDIRRATRDLDAVFEPTSTVREAAEAVAAERGIRADWLNDAVKGYLHGKDPDAVTFYESDHLRVDVASPQYLLAMKLLAARAGIDTADIVFLYGICGFTTVDEGLRLVESAYAGLEVPPRTRYMLEEIVASLPATD